MFMIITNIYCAPTMSRHMLRFLYTLSHSILHPLHAEITIIIADKHTEAQRGWFNCTVSNSW